ncbi:hypothetical protein ALC53_06191 [Atta colombica]|uniref:Uncharacterized protein n=1 Tax=Atta colombica TaxID=520822 RepID=A0A195BH15_9HYME|nr:hypothetical protein ALC53_06191 [Atta colombica]
MIRQAIHHDETLTVLDVQIAHRRELLGAGSVKDLEDTWRVVHLDLFAIEILDCWIVLLHEATGYELDDGSRETRIDLRRLVVRLPGYYGDYTATPGHDDTGRLSVRTFYTQARIRRHSSHPCLPACRQRYPRPCRGTAEEETVVGFHKCLKNHNIAMPLSVATMSSLMTNWRNLRTEKNSLNNCSRSNNFTEVISDIGDPICEPQMRACDTL